jgi:uncharacterized membrane protein YeaQ/YmgE (transglycosylase-associated protein family)
MNSVFWILSGGITGWLVGTLLREKGYGRVLSRGFAGSVDILFGVAGAAMGAHILFWAAIGKGTMFGNYGTAILGAATLVGLCRVVCQRFFRPRSYKGMSRAAFIQWHDSLTMKELASWKRRPRETSTTPTENPQR